MIIIIIVAGILIHDIYQMNGVYIDAMSVDESYAITSEDTVTLDVVEFLSYSCPYCRDAHPVIMEALKRDGNIRYIPRPLGGSDENTIKATLLVYAAANQGKFIELHNEIIENYHEINEQTIQNLSLQYGMDAEQLKSDMDNPEVQKLVDQNQVIFQTLGGYGTPSYLIGSNILFAPSNGPLDVEDFLRMFNEARGNAS